MKLYITGSSDRDAVILALSRNGYTVRQGTEKQTDGKRRESFVDVAGRNIDLGPRPCEFGGGA